MDQWAATTSYSVFGDLYTVLFIQMSNKNSICVEFIKFSVSAPNATLNKWIIKECLESIRDK